MYGPTQFHSLTEYFKAAVIMRSMDNQFLQLWESEKK